MSIGRPFLKYWAMTSAWRPNESTSTKVTSSLVSPASFFHERLIARPSFAMATPLGVYRNSGSRVKFPARMTLLKFAILNSFVLGGCGPGGGSPGEQHTEHLCVHCQPVFQLVESSGFALEDH